MTYLRHAKTKAPKIAHFLFYNSVMTAAVFEVEQFGAPEDKRVLHVDCKLKVDDSKPEGEHADLARVVLTSIELFKATPKRNQSERTERRLTAICAAMNGYYTSRRIYDPVRPNRWPLRTNQHMKGALKTKHHITRLTRI